MLDADTPWSIELSSHSGGRATARLAVRFLLVNRGRGLARYPSLTVGHPVGYRAANWTGQHGGSLPLRSVMPPSAWWLRFAGGADIVVYPDDEIEAASVQLEVTNAMTVFPDLRLPYRVVAAGVPTLSAEVFVSGEKIRQRAGDVFTQAGQPFAWPSGLA